MELTAQERDAIERGGVVRYVIPESRIECVVVRQELLDSLRARVDYSPCDADDLARLTSEVLADEEWTAPEASPTQQPS